MSAILMIAADLDDAGKYPHDGADHQRDDDRADHDGGGIAGRLFLRDLHQRRQADPQQVESVKAENAQQPEPGNKREDAREPNRRHRVDRKLQSIGLILLPLECRRQRIDDKRHHIHHHKRQNILDKRGGNAGYDPDPDGPDDWHANSDDRRADEAAHRRDSGENGHIIRKQIGGIAGLPLDHRPFRLRRQHDRFGPRDNIHDVPPLLRRALKPSQAPMMLPDRTITFCRRSRKFSCAVDKPPPLVPAAAIHHCLGNDETATRTLPSASATMRRIFESYSMSTSRKAVTAAATCMPGSARRNSASAAPMLCWALAAKGLRSSIALLPSAACR